MLYITMSIIPTSCLLQYYNIQTRAVAPFDYFEDGNATNPIGPPLLQVCVKQYDKWKFDAATHDIYLSEETHICE